MENGNPERRLAAIVAIDVVGYSRLMGADEKATLSVLKSHQEALTPTVQSHGGRIVNTAGDGFLLEFPSVVEALECAIEVQAAMAMRNADIPEDKKMLFRIGINLGDILVHTDDDIFGDGVNVAARIEALTPAGGICMSRTVRNQVRDKMDVNLEDMGEIDVKNIARPIRVFRVLKEGETASKHSRKKPLWQKVAAVVALMIVTAGGLWHWQPWIDGFVLADPAKMVFPLPDKPSIAVLPFDNMSDDLDQEYFADGITEDIITDLSKVSGLFVIARNSTFVYKGKPTKIGQIAEELGVRYVLEGSVRRVGEQVRINAQLIDATTGGHLWAERYDGTLDDVFALQDNITKKIVTALAIKLTQEEQFHFSRITTANPQAHDAFLRGWAHYRRDSPADLARAVPFLKQALKLDPTYHRASATLAAVYWRGWSRGETSRGAAWQTSLGLSQPETLSQTMKYLQKALIAPVPLAHQVASGVLVRKGQFDEAIVESKRAIVVDKNDPAGYEALASALIFAGRPAESLDIIDKAIRLDPLNSDNYLYWLGLAQFGLEHFNETAKNLQTVTQSSPDDDLALLILAASYGHLGREKEARYTVELVNRVRAEMDKHLSNSGLELGIDVALGGPYTLQDVDFWQFKNREDRERLRLGLQKAGVPAKGKAKTVSPVSIVGATTVGTQEAKALFDRGAKFVDVRGNLFSLGHIPGAKHLFLKKDFNEQSLAAAVGKNEAAVIYCMGPKCLLSSKAIAQAVSWGYGEVFYFRDGFPAWKAAGYPVALSK